MVQSSTLPAGDYLFAIYRWKTTGVRLDESFVPVASNPTIEEELLDLLETAADVNDGPPLQQSDFDQLDRQHHSKWSAARANHIAENRQLVEHRIQSLRVSHRARTAAIADQIARTTNAKIHLMKQSELVRADADFHRRMAELEQAAESGDVLSNAVLFGTVRVIKEEDA
jgi:hypothetical protein